MKKPQTTAGLMKHLKNNNININGQTQKRQLICYGYYHGYKGYRFIKTTNTQIPYQNFSELVAVIEYDNNLKSILYPNLMFIETAIKNIVCNEVVNGLKDCTFDYVFKTRMKDNPSDSTLQLNRLRLRNTIYSRISSRYKSEENIDNKMIRHFYDRGEDAPLWTVFEILCLGDLADFVKCLNTSVRNKLLSQMNMLDISIDTNCALLSNLLYTIKTLRNSVAHNNIIFDTRFKDRNVNRVLKAYIEKETGIKNICLYSLFDYIIILIFILKKIDFNHDRANNLLQSFITQNKLLKESVSDEIYSLIVQNNTVIKIELLQEYLNR